MDTLGSMRSQLSRYIRDDDDNDLLNDTINDAIESLWRSIVMVHLGQFMGGPINTLTFAPGSERQDIVSIADPTTPPVLQTIVEGNLVSRTLKVGYTLVTDSGSQTKLSGLATITVPANSILKVLPPAWVSGAIGWLPYATDQTNNTRMAQQADAPLDFNQFFVEPTDTGIVDDPDAPAPPTVNNTADDVFYIRLIEVQNQNQTYTRWQAGNLDDLLMQRAARGIASASTYQPYAYDFINGRTVEVRPVVAGTVNPRYFYVIKPRRLRFDRSIIPFTNISYTEFVKMYAASQLSLSLKEFAAADMEGSRAEGIRLEILQGLNIQATTKQRTITPFFNW